MDLKTFAALNHRYLADRGVISSKWWAFRSFSLAMSPEYRAAVLFFAAAQGKRLTRRIARNLLQTLHSCDVREGAIFRGVLYLPHPVGIVVGGGVEIGDEVTIYQGVTLGVASQARPEYPVIESKATIYAGACILGRCTVGHGARVGAHALVMTSVAPGAVVPAGGLSS